MPFADTHCHLDFSEFAGNRESLIQQCKVSDIQMLIVPGVARSTWGDSLRFAEFDEIVKAAIGLHPYFLSEHTESDITCLDAAVTANRSKLVAIGEIGLDDTRPQLDRQVYFFDAQLDLAEKHGLPIIMHMRRNHGQGLKLVRKRNLVGGVVHAFSGSIQDALAWVDLGMKIGVGGVITYERAVKTRQTIEQLPLDSLVLETDAPDMAIQGVEKGAGSPLMVLDIFDVLASIRKEPLDVLKNALWRNSQALFATNR